MDNKALARLRPAADTPEAIQAATEAVRQEEAAAQTRLITAKAKRDVLLATGTNAEVRAAEEAARDAELDLERLKAIAGQLSAQLTDSVAAEHGRALAEQIRQAEEAILAFNEWFSTEYEPHARAIAVGVELERKALRAREALRNQQTKALSVRLPPIALAWVGTQSRSLSFLTRLPAAECGAPIVWAS
jgi:hypothetical protein